MCLCKWAAVCRCPCVPCPSQRGTKLLMTSIWMWGNSDLIIGILLLIETRRHWHRLPAPLLTSPPPMLPSTYPTPPHPSVSQTGPPFFFLFHTSFSHIPCTTPPYLTLTPLTSLPPSLAPCIIPPFLFPFCPYSLSSAGEPQASTFLLRKCKYVESKVETHARVWCFHEYFISS